MGRLSRLILAFSILFAVFLISPTLLSGQFALYRMMKIGEVLDVFTPLILIPLYWALFRVDAKEIPRPSETIAFLVLATLWVEGQGMHLSANSIARLAERFGSDVYALSYFYDEELSHYLWHSGLMGLSALLVYRQWRHPFLDGSSSLGMVGLAGFFYGVVFFVAVVEAQTAPLGVPFAVLAVVFSLVWGRNKMRHQPLLAFFFVGYLVAATLFAGWAIYWGGLPEFSKVGII